MGRIEAANEFVTLEHREFRWTWVFFKEPERNVREPIKRGRSCADDSP
jgi:hypothetical protein